MATGGEARFERGRLYTRGGIHAALGGSRRAALVTKGRTVVCLCLTRERNPRAPDEMVICGHGGSVKLARELAGSAALVPVFVRAPRGGWEYAGERRVRAVSDGPEALPAPVAEDGPAGAPLVLLLEELPAPTAGRPADPPATPEETSRAAGE